MEFSNGRMEEDTKAIGNKENRMAKDAISLLKEK